MFLNYSDNNRLDYCWTKNFFLRRLVVFAMPEWRFRILADFPLAWWLPEIYFQASCDKLSRSLDCDIYPRRWIDNLKTVFLKNANFKSSI
jgi:hypothetical protein